MKIKNIIFIMIVVSLVSCSILESRKQIYAITGKVTTTKYNVPLPSNLSLYSKKKLINSINTNEKGEYKLVLKKKHLKKDCFVIIKPLKNNVNKDTIIPKREIIGIEVSGFGIDTVFLDLKKNRHNFILENEHIILALEGEIEE